MHVPYLVQLLNLMYSKHRHLIKITYVQAIKHYPTYAISEWSIQTYRKRVQPVTFILQPRTEEQPRTTIIIWSGQMHPPTQRLQKGNVSKLAVSLVKRGLQRTGCLLRRMRRSRVTALTSVLRRQCRWRLLRPQRDLDTHMACLVCLLYVFSILTILFVRRVIPATINPIMENWEILADIDNLKGHYLFHSIKLYTLASLLGYIL